MIIFKNCVRIMKVRGLAFATTRVDHGVATGVVVGRRLRRLQHRAPPCLAALQEIRLGLQFGSKLTGSKMNSLCKLCNFILCKRYINLNHADHLL